MHMTFNHSNVGSNPANPIIKYISVILIAYTIHKWVWYLIGQTFLVLIVIIFL